MAELRVVATAGHVDHGKSALIARLTGMDPDRWEEEKRRGLTIDLGYAWVTLPSGREIGFVDVPGHERFIGNMLAGVGPVRLVLFVVAADEGWKPQSEEHLEILDVLGVAGGVVALTKRDLVDDETLALAESECARPARGHRPWRRRRSCRSRPGPATGSTRWWPRSTRCSPTSACRSLGAPGSSSTACSRSRARGPWSPGRSRATAWPSATTSSSCPPAPGRGSEGSRPTNRPRIARAR